MLQYSRDDVLFNGVGGGNERDFEIVSYPFVKEDINNTNVVWSFMVIVGMVYVLRNKYNIMS